MTCLVSGGADSTCLWDVLRELGYRVSALHVDHGLRGAESDEDARFCRERPRRRGRGRRRPVAPRTSCASSATRSRPTGSARPAIPPRTRSRPSSTASSRADAPAPGSSRSARTASCGRCSGSGAKRPRPTARRPASRTARTARTPTRSAAWSATQILPLLEQLDPRARENLLSLATAQEEPRLPRTLERTLHELLASPRGTQEADLGGGIHAVREYGSLSLERGPVRFGPWTIASNRPGLEVRAWHPGDRLQGRRKKVQDIFVDAKVPRRERAAWPLVVEGDEVVCVPGIVETAGVEWERDDDAD